MHLEGPWLSTTGRSRARKKFRNAAEAAKSRELDRSWQELLKRQGVEQDQRRRDRALSAEPLTYKLTAPAGRGSTAHIKSLGDYSGVATMPAPKVYTGTKIKGIATMHKSNAVPVFSDEEAVDISKMRR